MIASCVSKRSAHSNSKAGSICLTKEHREDCEWRRAQVSFRKGRLAIPEGIRGEEEIEIECPARLEGIKGKGKRRREEDYSSLRSSRSTLNVEIDQEGEGEMISPFPDEVVEHVLEFLSSHKDRNSMSLVCKAWFRAEKWSRHRVFVGNCYAVSPEQVIHRFPKLNSLTIKGRPRFSDFGFVPDGWGAYIDPWIAALAQACPWMEELRCRRMTISDESLALLSRCFPNFQSLVLVKCDGFTTDGLASVTANCRNLAHLMLDENEMEDRGTRWLSYFPETHTSLVSLNFSTFKGSVDFESLESLVARSKNLASLKVHRDISLEQLQRLLVRAPQLKELGTGEFSQNLRWSQVNQLYSAFRDCKGLESLSGFWEVNSAYLPSLTYLFTNLKSLNLCDVTLHTQDFQDLITCCHNLERLLVQDYVKDRGLQLVASICKNLREIRVYPSSDEGFATEEGLIALSEGCPNLKKILYFCKQMTNEAIISFAWNIPGVTHFRLCILEPMKPDHVTQEPFDKGFGAVAQYCTNLQRLAVSGLLTDRAFEYIGRYAKKLESIAIAFAGESDKGLEYLLHGCSRLKKLEIRDCPFGDPALRAGMHRFMHMRSLWLSGGMVSWHGASWIAKEMPHINVEVMKEETNDGLAVDKLYLYRSLCGPRPDTPAWVETLQ